MSNLTFAHNSEIEISHQGHVATVTFSRPPHNFFTLDLLQSLADAFEQLDDLPDTRVTILSSTGKSFCAGADFNDPRARDPSFPELVYAAGLRLFSIKKPMIAAVQGPAVGGGLGLALVADFRVADENARFVANFARLGIHPGFGLSTTLPRLIGQQQAAMLFYTGRRIKASEAVRIGLADVLADPNNVQQAAMALAQEMASAAPLALQSIRATLRQDLAYAVKQALVRESSEQKWQMQSTDFIEGVAAMTTRREPIFTGK